MVKMRSYGLTGKASGQRGKDKERQLYPVVYGLVELLWETRPEYKARSIRLLGIGHLTFIRMVMAKCHHGDWKRI